MINNDANREKMIKESFDNLPTGIIFAKLNGVIMLANDLMYNLYYKLDDSTLQSAHAFWYSLTQEHRQIDLIETGKTPTLQFPDGKIYRFSKRLIKIKGERVIQILAVDISELDRLRQKELSKYQKLIALRHKMVETKVNLENLTRREEVLDAKLKIHNTMGMGLAAIRRYLATGEGDLEKALTIWRRSVELLVNSDDFETTDSVQGLRQAAQSIGIALCIEGKWPKKRPKIEKVIIAVGRECLINAHLHGAARRMRITILETESDYKISFVNDGRTSNKAIVAGGGFMAIEKALEPVQGSFKVIQAAQFTVELSFLKEF